MLRLQNLELMYEPYPIGCAAQVFIDEDYTALVDSYPDAGLFVHKPDTGDKFSLSEFNNPAGYDDFISGNPNWKRFHSYIKSDEFITGTLEYLKSVNVDLGLRRVLPVSQKKTRKTSIISRILRKTVLSTRFEFSMINGQGGYLRPHTDHHNKLITLVLSMVKQGEWKDEWGGGTQVCLPKDRTAIFNHVNNYMEFDEVDIQHNYPFNPNQCILFVKTYNSWHQVAPLTATDDSHLRKTLTINIERLQ